MISLEEAKRQIGQTENFDDLLIDSLIKAAGETVANYTGRVWQAASFTEYYDGFSEELLLQYAPFISLTSFEYKDADSNWQTVDASNYVVDSTRTQIRLRRAYGVTWPTTEDGDQLTVRATYRAGHTELESPNTVPLPDPLRLAALMLIGANYDAPEGHAPVQMHEIPHGIKFHMAPYKLIGV